MMRKALLLIMLFACASTVVGQGIVVGKVTSEAGEAMEYVSVGVVGRTIGCTTDDKGEYRLKVGSRDSITVRFTYTGYEPQERRLLLSGGKTVRVDVVLKPSSKQLEAVEIKDEKSRQSQFTNIDVQRLESAVGPSGGVESVLKTLPDVGSNNELSSQYTVRGGSFDENLVYINGIEVFRPMLIRSGQQEGMSIVNPDLVDYIMFSPGGFDASYGDKMSSVLDITYNRPTEFRGRASASLLGASASVEGTAGKRWTYAVATRFHSNQYLMRTLDTKGAYTNRYLDIQALAGYKASEKLGMGLLGIVTNNVYALVPESQTTAFSQRSMELDVYFDGAEEDRYSTMLAALTADYMPCTEWHIESSLSLQQIVESERYDIQSQYWLYQLGLGEGDGEVERLDRGVGTFLEHARNRLRTAIGAFDVRATRSASFGTWQMGLKLQGEKAADRLREWRWVDSAGYALPTAFAEPGDSSAMPEAPVLQQYANSNSGLATVRSTAFVQRDINLQTKDGTDINLLAGIRGGVYQSDLEHLGAQMRGERTEGSSSSTGLRPIIAPRLSASIKPPYKQDILFRLATGVYHQPPFYREYRLPDGGLMADVRAQTSYQAMATVDWNLRLWERPFKITADVYYKYITDLIPYTIDNLRIAYHPDQQAVAYAAGLSLRINGEIVDDLESWASLSLMRTQEDIEGDEFGWLDRPTDQRLSVKLFLQDYVPRVPWWRMSMTLVYATGMPVVAPYGRQDPPLRLPSYFRVDWGNTVQLARFRQIGQWRIFRYIDDIHIGVEVFNLFDRLNTISYLWVTDYDNHPYRVPNYLTSRQLNVKLSILF